MSGFILKTFRGAISEYENKGLAGSAKFVSNMDLRRKRDSLKAQQGLANDLAAGGLMNARCKFTVPADDTNTYFFLENGRILKRTSAGVYSLPFTETEGIITGAEQAYDELGNVILYWATLTKLHCKVILDSAGAAVNTNWSDVDATINGQTCPKTNLTSSTDHAMKWVNGSLLGVNVSSLYLVGYDSSYTNNALQIQPGISGKTLFDLGLSALIAANRLDDKEQSWLLEWDTSSLDYNDKTPLSFANINAIVKAGGITMIQYGTEGQLHFVGDSTDLPIVSFPGGGQVDIDGVEVDRGLAMFGVYGNGAGKTGIYSYGRRTKNADFTLNLEYQFDCDEINSVKKIGTVLTFCYKLGSTYGVKKVDTANKATRAIYESLDCVVPPTFIDAPMHNSATLTLAPLPAGCSIELWRRLDKIETGGTDYEGNFTAANNGWFQCETPDGKGVYEEEGGIEAVFNMEDTARIVEFGIVLNCSGNNSPEVLTLQSSFGEQ
jgi:hypothetical protein